VATLLPTGGVTSPSSPQTYGVPDECEPDANGDHVIDACDQCPNTMPGAVVDAQGCPPPIVYDFDRDGDVDAIDFAAFQRCYSGENNPANPNCVN
jgi:hypothetical protein